MTVLHGGVRMSSYIDPTKKWEQDEGEEEEEELQ